jgi:hypothetical protein
MWPKVNVYAHTPKFDSDGAKCMVVIGDIHRTRKRLTPPRGAGQIERMYRTEVMIYATNDDAQKGADAFDDLCESTETILSSAPGTPRLVDPRTGQVSLVTHTAEDVDLHVLAAEITPVGGKVIFRALFTIQVIEVLVG